MSGGAPTLQAVKNPCLTYSQPSISVIPLYPCSDCRDSTNCKLSSTISSVTQSRPTLCDPMDCGTPGFSVHHHFPEPTQTHVHSTGEAIQVSSSDVPFSSCLQSFPAPGSFQMSWFFACGQSIGVSASASVLPMNTQDSFPLG